MIATQRLKVVLIEYLDASLCHVNRLDTNILVDLLHLIVLSLWREVWAHDAVHAEHAVVWLVVHAEIASICPIAFACFGVNVVNGLVNPVPNGATHEEIRALDGVPVVDEVADRVAHGMRVLRDVIWVLYAVLAFHSLLHPGNRRILV